MPGILNATQTKSQDPAGLSRTDLLVAEAKAPEVQTQMATPRRKTGQKRTCDSVPIVTVPLKLDPDTMAYMQIPSSLD